jgi:spermidine synthase
MLPSLTLLFALSGAAALIYEIVWLEMLQLIVGSTAVSLAVLLSTFMGGLCLGSILLPRFVSARIHPLRVFAFIEVGIGACGIAVLHVMPLVDWIYAASAVQGFNGILLRAAIASLCLLPPTILMGASLPAISRWVKGSGPIGYLYGANTFGAMCGCLAAGFYLLRVYDVTVASYVAVAMNFAIAAIAWRLAAGTAHREDAGPRTAGGKEDWSVSTAIALSGLCALGAEVVWTRQLSLLLGGTVYTFSLILAGFLAGIGAGGGAGAFIAGRTKHPRLALGLCQFLLAGAITRSAYVLANVLPYLNFNSRHRFTMDFLYCLAAILPPALLWGASFSFALAALVDRGLDAARATSRIYAVNTIGAIAGALLFSLVLSPKSAHSNRSGC